MRPRFYTIDEINIGTLIGSGSYGKVYSATIISSGTKVILKQISCIRRFSTYS